MIYCVNISDYNGLKYMLSLDLDCLDVIVLRLKFSKDNVSVIEEVKMIVL